MSTTTFTVKNASGKVLRFGTCTEEAFKSQAINPGETVVRGLPPEERLGPLSTSYQYKRFLAYPSVGDQLDALYHAMDSGLIPKVPGFYDQIKAVKDSIPKE